jgi:putative PIN family toxin of toxin-antitoxin system
MVPELMRVVLDTNILISALISPYGPPEAIYRAWRTARFELVTSDFQLDEIKRATRYPKLRERLKPAQVGTLMNALRRETRVLGQLDLAVETADPDDAFLAAMAMAAQADYLVTGDKRAGLLQLEHIGRTRILTPVAFQAEVLDIFFEI